ncbi:Rossmann-like alpha/beta/alpha sandwich fold [Sesbania bispinosa]|nr:Rossmann-like alpha/beta/alpha sandwich fold [Sesbania bispinosa]
MDIMESHDHYGNSSTGVSEIEEEDCDDTHHRHDEPPMATICEEDSVYVAVGKSETSMEALLWTLNNLTNHSTILYLIHVFPEIKHIPNPLGAGMIPRDKVSAEQVESYVAEERGKRRDLLQKFLQSCSTSKVKADTILIESDLVAKAIIDLIPILQIRNLVIGANKFYLRKSRSKKGNGIADQVLQNAPENCKVRIICEGKEVNEQMQLLSPPPQVLTPRTSANDTSITRKEDQQNDSVSWLFSSLLHIDHAASILMELLQPFASP